MARLDGKVALISGGARGMGASHARAFVAEGARVVLGDVRHEEGEAVAAELGDAARYVPLDVASYPGWEAAVHVAESEFGRLDVLVNNAGIAHWEPLDNHSLESWDRVLTINLTGSFYGIKAAVPALKRSGRGSIVNISSIAGIQGFASMSAYTASKFGVRGLTKSAALELGPASVRVNSVHPGRIETPINEGRSSVPMTTVALQRAGQPIEITELIVHLASDESSYTTGTEFIVDGGLTAGRMPS